MPEDGEQHGVAAPATRAPTMTASWRLWLAMRIGWSP
jgi:hypothetical protein